jgi:hypothetical protein
VTRFADRSGKASDEKTAWNYVGQRRPRSFSRLSTILLTHLRDRFFSDSTIFLTMGFQNSFVKTPINQPSTEFFPYCEINDHFRLQNSPIR